MEGLLGYFEIKKAKFVSCLKKAKYPVVSLIAVLSD